jgi:ketosteroid isomerase-like protein
MSRETSERSPDRSYERVLRSIFEGWAHGDLTAGSELLAEHIRYSAAQPEGQVRADGRAAMSGFLRDFFASWESYWIELHELEQRSPVAFLASGTQHGIGKGSHVQTSMPTFIAIRFRDDEIVQLEFFYERARAVATLAE